MSEFHQLILTLISFATLLIGYFGVREKIKERKEKRFWQRRREEERTTEIKNKMMLIDFKQEVVKNIQAMLTKYTTVEKNDKDNKEIRKELNDIKRELELHNDHFINYQRTALANEIIKYADTLRRGHPKSRNSFQHIASSYEKYKALGGNHYVDEEWAYIKEAMKRETD